MSKHACMLARFCSLRIAHQLAHPVSTSCLTQASCSYMHVLQLLSKGNHHALRQSSGIASVNPKPYCFHVPVILFMCVCREDNAVADKLSNIAMDTDQMVNNIGKGLAGNTRRQVVMEFVGACELGATPE